MAPSRRYQCASCGKQFTARLHMRSHQSRSCTAPNLDDIQEQHAGDIQKQGGPSSRPTVPAPITAVPEQSAEMTHLHRANGVDDSIPDPIDEQCANEFMHISTDYNAPIGSILFQLDNRRRVCDDIFNFYDSLTHRSERIIKEPVHMMDVVRECPAYVQDFLHDCYDKSLSKSAVSCIYNTIVRYESNLPHELRLLSEHIPGLGQLHGILNAMHEDRLYREAWMTAIIDLNDLHSHLGLRLPISCTGTFRCPLQLLKKQLDLYGTSSIHPFQMSRDANGVRTYSGPYDSAALEGYTEEVGRKGTVVCIDIYCDVIALPNGGSQTVTPLRVRFSNIRNIVTVWFDIGLCPSLFMGNTACASGKISELRSELFHRYLFLVFKPVIQATRTGFRHSNTTLFPRIFMVLCDQKQESPLVSLKRNNSTRDCTTCDMLSRITAAEISASVPPPSPNGTNKRSHADESSHSDSSSNSKKRRPSAKRKKKSVDNSEHGSASDSEPTSTKAKKAAAKKAKQAAYAALCLQRQCSSPPAAQRNVVRTLGVQLLLAICKGKVTKTQTSPLLAKLKSTLHPCWFTATPDEMAVVRHYSMQYSCCELPPFLGAFHGLGSEPFYMYRSIAFDTLHAIDLGILRMFPDLSFDHFSAKPNYTTIPTSQCISIANSRLKLIPRGAHISRIPLFIAKASDQLAGVTGLVRRQSCPFLWICVLGLNTKVSPDDDPLVQAALELNDIHCSLLGINEDMSHAKRSAQWIENIQSRCFELGTVFTKLFGTSVNTKLHRVMRHLRDHLISFGTLRWGSTDVNETQHKTLKLAYRNTNRRPQSLAIQLLKNGYANELENTIDGDDGTTLHADMDTPSSDHDSATVASTVHELNSNNCISVRLQKLLSLTYSKRRGAVWFEVPYSTLKNYLPWDVHPEQQHIMNTFTYRPWSTTHKDIRMDACHYRIGEVEHCGFVERIIRSKKYTNRLYFITRRLQLADNEPGNTVATVKYKHLRYKYYLNVHGRLQLDLVPTFAVLYPAFLVVDPTVLVDNFTLQTANVSCLETEEHRHHSRFFNMKGVPLTSFKENCASFSNSTA